jgi:Phycobilisome degradation protein nblA
MSELTTEQEFNIYAFAAKIKPLSKEESQAFLVDLYRQMVVKETTYKRMLLESAGIVTPLIER